ncbi:MAG: helix-turn-helix domain-containing protein [Nocardioidaceae bacterium]
MEAELLVPLREVDPAVLGGRIKAARIGAGLTQGELAGDEISVAYVSRIESGQRRPDGALLETLAARLGVTPDFLVLGANSADVDELRLLLDYAELALESGNAADGLDKARQALMDVARASLPDLERRARFLHARALEATGDSDGAIIALEELAKTGEADLAWTKVMIALCRCYRDAGDLGKSIETGEKALGMLDGVGLSQSDEAIQLAVTLAGVYGLRGDVAYAARICKKAIGDAEKSGSPAARAAAYWNASFMESMRGRTQTAIDFASRALDLLTQTNDVRNRARLRSTLGMYQLEAEPAELDAAKYNLATAVDELEWSSASPFDVGSTKVALARAFLLSGETVEAGRLLAETQALGSREDAPAMVAESRILAGQIALSNGDELTARHELGGAAIVLKAIGDTADRTVAQLWFDLGGLLDQMGEGATARDAYRRAAGATGLVPMKQMVAATPEDAAATSETLLVN